MDERDAEEGFDEGFLLRGYHLQPDWWAREGLVGETQAAAPRGADPRQPCCPPACLPRAAARGDGMAASLLFQECSEGAASTSDTQEEKLQWRMGWEAGDALLVCFMMYIWAREKNASCNAVAWWPQSTASSGTGRSSTGKAAPRWTSIRDLRAWAQPPLALTSTHATSLQTHIPAAYHASLQGEKPKALTMKPGKPKDVNVPLKSGSCQAPR